MQFPYCIATKFNDYLTHSGRCAMIRFAQTELESYFSVLDKMTMAHLILEALSNPYNGIPADLVDGVAKDLIRFLHAECEGNH